jgi:DNA-binding NarL/FixJ family response regulator
VTVAVLEGHDALRRRLVLAVEADDELHVVAEGRDAASAAEACAELQPRCVVVSGDDSSVAVAEARAVCPGAAVVLVITPRDADEAVAGLRAGARGFVNRAATGQLPAVVRAVVGGAVALPPLLAGALADSGGRPAEPEPALSGDERGVLRQLAAGRSYGAAAAAVGIPEARARALVAGVVDRFQASSEPAGRAPCVVGEGHGPNRGEGAGSDR